MILASSRFLPHLLRPWLRSWLRSWRWYLAWTIWLAVVFTYLDYRAVYEGSLSENSLPESNRADTTDNNSVEIVADMQMVSLPPPPPMPSIPVKNLPVQNLPVQKLPVQKVTTPTVTVQTSALSQEKAENQNKQSRLWLAKLEDGEGPSIVFTWPENANEREWIQQRLYRCGVRLGKWRNGRLRAIEVGVGTVSGFIRVFSGDVSVKEESRLQVLAGEGQPVRVFPRSLDIHLLRQLSNATSGGFMGAKQVSAEYKRSTNGVNIRNIQVDGQIFEKGVSFLPENGQCS